MPVVSSSNPNDEVVEIEEITANEVITCLWSKSSTEKCRIGLADVVLYDGGDPVRWYVTGKTGEVLKKKAVDMPAVKERWEKICSRTESSYYCVVRQEGGVLKFLGKEAWDGYMQSKTRDRSIMSLHCFIKGQSNSIYRNKFELRDRLGRFTTTTHAYTYGQREPPKNSGSKPYVPEPVIVLAESRSTFTESRASSIKNIMDLATNTIVRYIQNMLGITVLELSIDYVIDTKSQLWMLWTSDAKVVRTTNLAAVTVPGLHTGDNTGRMGWAGNKYADDYKTMVLDGRVAGRTSRSPSPTRSLPGSPGRSPSRGRGDRFDDMSMSQSQFSVGGDPLRNTMDEHGKVLPTKAAVQMDSAMKVVEQPDAGANGRGGGKKAYLQNITVNEPDQRLIDPRDNQFPDAFKCKGEYCNIRFKTSGDLHAPSRMDVHLFEKCFTQKELDLLRKDKNYGSMMDFSADGPGLATITQKSIVLAKRERRGMEASGTSGQAWKTYPVSPRDRASSANSGDVGRGGLKNASLEEDLKHEEQLAGDKQHREEFTKSMVDYYKEVRVCGVCFKAYTTFDWARKILGLDDAHGAGQERGARKKTPSKQVKDDASMASLQSDDSLAARKKDKLSGLLGGPADRDDGVDEEKRGGGSPGGNGPGSPSKGKGGGGLRSASPRRGSPSPRSARGRSGSRGGSPSRSPSPGRRGKGAVDKDKDKDKRTWKDYLDKETKAKKNHDEFGDLDEYLRQGSQKLAVRKQAEKEKYMRKRIQQLAQADGSDAEDEEGNVRDDSDVKNLYRGQVLLACEDNIHAFEAKSILEEAFFDVHLSRDGRQALNDFQLKSEKRFDVIIAQRDLPLGDAFEIVKAVRDIEKMERRRAAKDAANAGKGVQPYTKRYPIICYTDKTTPDDLKEYMKGDLDGCVSFPVNKMSLLNTIRAAIPHHLAQLDEPIPEPPPEGAKVYKLGPMGELEGSTDSATRAAETLPVSAKLDNDIAHHGVVQIDADTRVPYTVLDASKTSPLAAAQGKPFFNLIVIHDMFDTAERFKILLRPMVQKYLGMQVLLWNYPGQAFTEWRPEQLINNEYIANCLNEVLGQVGEKGTKDFDTSRPFYIMGYGYGSIIATYYASHYRVPNLRGLLSFNGWAFIDSYLAGVMHDCSNIFECSPPSRPDLPVYFFSRFLFSKEYLAKVSVPLALNIYTAVHNPISLIGRINLCKGVMGSVETRSLLKEIDCPLICVQSTQDSFARPLHTEPFTKDRGGEVRSIYKALREPQKTCVVWMKGGHEVFQECRKQSQLLIEQILTGFFESHDITFPAAPIVDKQAAETGTLISSMNGERKPMGHGKTVEDKFIDHVLDKYAEKSSSVSGSTTTGGQSSPTNRGRAGAGAAGSPRRSTSPGQAGASLSPTGKKGSVMFSASDPGAWEEYSQTMAEGSIMGAQAAAKRTKKGRKGLADEGDSTLVMDPSVTSFERQDSIAYGPGAQKAKGLDVKDFPEVKEYMGWRLKRNKKRLQRLQGAARIIQGGFRSYMARVFVRNIKRKKAAAVIQKAYRGWIGRCDFLDQARRIWATQMIQRAWRGYLGRKWYFAYRLRIASAANIQRVFRGHLARRLVEGIKRVRNKAAGIIQALFRRYKGRKDAFALRLKRNSALTLQRVYRGHLGRRRASAERDKYIFSRSQSQGIEFGRQMLLEHKLHATKLQSDVTLLTQEKVGCEEQVEALLEEISSFEEGVRTLEKEMHQLTRVEAESAAYMDEESRYALRDQKTKLDKEFGEMLGKIGNRKDMLYDLEGKLSSIDKQRQIKEEELRTLERKLVVLLEEQQNELNAIKRKQDVRGAMLAASHDELLKATAGAPGSQALAITEDAQAGQVATMGGGGSGGPSLTEKKQAAQLMQSTETLMKFGFMSMSMTYFSSLNMIKALRTVSAQDTVMAALADVHSQRAADGGSGGGGGEGEVKGNFVPHLKPGQAGGQESMRVSSWSVEDVSKWLQTIALGQYTEAFIDAAIDGEFLYDLNDDDLKNTLGIEHRLHRKKILNCVHRLKMAEAQKDSRLADLLRETGSMEEPDVPPDENPIGEFPDNPFKTDDGNVNGVDRRQIDGPSITIDEILSLVRHSKLTLLKEAMDYLPSKPFDKSLVQVSYVPDFGTVYVEGYEKLPFHVNKMDEFGNTMLCLACQNGNIKIAKYLVSKGANPNHQNKQGQTPAHFAVAYKFFDMSQWLFEHGADDTLMNKDGLTCYDGLAGDEDGDDD